ncbi:hypothetical protein SAMN05216251_102116 [Actinacidiphila alni]|uniref:Uncharacterized protein n=1 Tax=Actinacidiphila alni TaxID=380248 RepID=A0A1I1YPB9_9ACTN|nr:hypothetical protein [Actinacidiphila alni]SFE21371.1 hypothetical protein SAMN05216251_102116 [Actinacidiphila alni]
MEQKTGQSTPPIPPAGFDPAFIPGLTPPARSAAEVPPGSTFAAGAADKEPAGTPEDEPETAPEAEVASEAEDAESAESADASEEAAEGEDTGPVFTVSDRRGSITADRTGITFKLDEESAEFGWDEIGAVEIDTPRFGRRFSVTVYTSSRRWFDTDVEAPSKADLKTWTAELESVLDTYFEDDEEKAAAEEKATEEVAEAAAGTEASDADTSEEKAEKPEDADA